MKRNQASGYWKLNYPYYLFLIPGLVFLILFEFLAMSKITIAFQDFKPLNIDGSPWVGFKHFYDMFADPHFFRVVRNTLVINFYKIIFILPVSLILAILLNEVRITIFKRFVQTIVYVPHFFTWVVVYSVFFLVFGSTGSVNTLITALGGEKIMFFMDGFWMRFLIVLSDGWHSVGWGTIVYLAAIAGINSEIYEAAIMDGANKFKQILHITIPSLIPTFVLMIAINLGHIMTSGFGQILVFYNSTVYDSVDIISTYVYRTGLGQLNYSYATAVGLFNSIIGFILVVFTNYLSKVTTGRSVW